MQIDPQVLQTDEWGEVKKCFGWLPIRLNFDKGSALVLKRSIPFVNKSFFYIPRGPVIDFHNDQLVKTFVTEVNVLAKKHNSLFLRIDPEVFEDDRISLSNLMEAGFIKTKKEVQPRSTFIVDLTNDLEKIRANFESKFRYNIHVAEKHGVKVVQLYSKDSIEEFYNIYQETCLRQNFIIHPKDYYLKIYENIIKSNMGSVFTAYYNEIPIASVIIFYLQKRLWYMYGASSNKFRNLMPNNLIHWKIIEWAKVNGFEKYDLWGIPSNPNPKHPLWGVYRFKKGFNGKLVKFIGCYDLPFNKILYKLLDKGIIFYQNLVRLLKKGTISDSLSE